MARMRLTDGGDAVGVARRGDPVGHRGANGAARIGAFRLWPGGLAGDELQHPGAAREGAARVAPCERNG